MSVTSPGAATERIAFARADWLGGVEYLHATYRKHAFDWHAHDEYVIAIVDAGADLIRCRGASHVATAGSILTLNPGEPHDGHGGWKYRVFYPSKDAFEQAMGDQGGGAPSFRDVVWRDETTWAQLSALHEMLSVPDCALAVQSAAVAAFARLAANGGKGAPCKQPTDSPRVLRAFELLNERFSEPVSLDSVSAEVGLHPNYLITAFRERYGVTPARFVRARRLIAAKTLLQTGAPLAHVAVDAGFTDQAHFTRCFVKAYGVSPGVYRALYVQRGGARYRPRR